MMAKPDPQIEPCPFCGSEFVNIRRKGPRTCWVECTNCPARGEKSKRRALAILQWNRRFSRLPSLKATVLKDEDAEEERVKAERAKEIVKFLEEVWPVQDAVWRESGDRG